MPLNGNIVPQTYYDDSVDSPYPTTSVQINNAAGQILTCSRTGRMWLEGSVSPYYIPLALQYQTTSAGSGTTTANIRRVNSGAAGNEVAGFEHTGAVVLTNLPTVSALGTDSTGRIIASNQVPTVFATVRNQTGSPIAKGKAVYINGATGQNPTIQLAQANAYETVDCIGLTAELIANGSTGKVVISGFLDDVDTHTFADGDTLYVSASSAGGLVNTDPPKPNWQMQVGFVEYAHNNHGKILVRPNLESTKTEYITDMTDAGEALATLAPMAESTILGRGSGFGSGDPEVITLGYGNSMTGLGTTLSTVLSHSSSFIVADFTLVNATQFYDITTLSLSAGVWLVQASALFAAAAAGTTQYTLDIYNNSTATSLACSATAHAAIANFGVNASCSVVVTLASTSTIAMRGAASVASRTVKYQSGIGGLSNATGLVAVRIG